MKDKRRVVVFHTLDGDETTVRCLISNEIKHHVFWITMSSIQKRIGNRVIRDQIYPFIEGEKVGCTLEITDGLIYNLERYIRYQDSDIYSNNVKIIHIYERFI